MSTVPSTQKAGTKLTYDSNLWHSCYTSETKIYWQTSWLIAFFQFKTLQGPPAFATWSSAISACGHAQAPHTPHGSRSASFPACHPHCPHTRLWAKKSSAEPCVTSSWSQINIPNHMVGILSGCSPVPHGCVWKPFGQNHGRLNTVEPS